VSGGGPVWVRCRSGGSPMWIAQSSDIQPLTKLANGWTGRAGVSGGALNSIARTSQGCHVQAMDFSVHQLKQDALLVEDIFRGGANRSTGPIRDRLPRARLIDDERRRVSVVVRSQPFSVRLSSMRPARTRGHTETRLESGREAQVGQAAGGAAACEKTKHTETRFGGFSRASLANYTN
jgi:hypothetical protein